MPFLFFLGKKINARLKSHGQCPFPLGFALATLPSKSKESQGEGMCLLRACAPLDSARGAWSPGTPCLDGPGFFQSPQRALSLGPCSWGCWDVDVWMLRSRGDQGSWASCLLTSTWGLLWCRTELVGREGGSGLGRGGGWRPRLLTPSHQSRTPRGLRFETKAGLPGHYEGIFVKYICSTYI